MSKGKKERGNGESEEHNTKGKTNIGMETNPNRNPKTKQLYFEKHIKLGMGRISVFMKQLYIVHPA